MYSEFLMVALLEKISNNEAYLNLAFKTFDKDEDGVITSEDL